MTTRRAPAAAATIALALLLAGCSSPVGEPTAPAAPGTPSAAPTVNAAPPAPAASDPPVSDETVHVIAVGDVEASISVPAAWSVEEGASDGFGEHRWLWIRNAEDDEMAVLSMATDGGLGGACDDWDGDGTGYVPAEIHLVEEAGAAAGIDDAAGPFLYAATVQEAEDRFSFHAGYSLERPADGRMPCLTYDLVTVPERSPMIMFGTPASTPDGERRFLVDSFDAGERYVETEEYATLMEVLRSLRLEAGP